MGATVRKFNQDILIEHERSHGAVSMFDTEFRHIKYRIPFSIKFSNCSNSHYIAKSNSPQPLFHSFFQNFSIMSSSILLPQNTYAKHASQYL